MRTLAELRQFMDQRLTLGQIRTFCFDLDIDYENLPGEIKRDKIVSTIQASHREEKLADLFDMLREEFEDLPGVDWDEAARIIRSLQQFDIAGAEFEGESRLPPPFQAPPPVSHFVERKEFDSLLADITQEATGAIRAVGLLGTGKSALACQAAHTLRERFPDGVIWLRGEPAALASDLKKTAVAYGQGQSFSQLTNLEEMVDYVARLLSTKQALVVLDGLEGEAAGRFAPFSTPSAPIAPC